CWKSVAGAIGYVGFEFADKMGLKTATLENREGRFVKPSLESCRAALASTELPENLRVFTPDPKSAHSYPIATYSWLLLRKKYKNPETADRRGGQSPGSRKHHSGR